MRGDNAGHASPGRDFSDVIHGEDLEFRETNQPSLMKQRHKGLPRAPLPFFASFLETQLITMAGAASGFVAGVFVCPLDVIKTRFQAKSVNYKYSGFFNAFKTIIHDEGPAALFRGVIPVTIGYLPTWAIYFTVYERAKGFYPRFFSETFGSNIVFMDHFAASITAGACCSILVNPIWVVKTRLMVQTGKEKVLYKGTVDAFKKMYHNEGIRVFYSGLVPSLFGLVHVGIHFPLYEKLKSILHVSESEDIAKTSNMTLWRLLVASSASKMIASTITYPHEILRTRMQMQSAEERRTLKLSNEFRNIYAREGYRGFYAGYITNLARTVPASAVTLVSFEYFKTYLLELSGRITAD
ncbi:hypothetical protein PUMCH_005074 [Australozyma saopauloensis]|uniref:Uncharacterized protein n=1 Tax=Australozyma saopauloensis TaxID=291208 RepID=A0AAX4HGE8_9ASCO|nr:hypothetical protein PUMCH_005074 [[Candida] saopauloensis]